MSTTNLLRMAAVTVLAVVAGLLTVQGTWALWNATTQANAGVVRAADFHVELNGRPMTVNGVAASIALQNPAPLTPGTSAHLAVTVTNKSNASGPFTIRATAGTAQISTQTPGLAGTLQVQTAPAPANGICSQATYSPSASVAVAKDAAAAICVRISLPAGASETYRGATAGVTLPITVTQLPQGG